MTRAPLLTAPWLAAGPLVWATLATPAPAQVTFVDVAQQTGTQLVGYGRGAGMDDLDQDGRMDLVALNAGMANFFFRQKPDGTFQSAASLWGVYPDTRQHWSVLLADFDSDGDADVYIANGGFTEVETNQVLRNDLGTSGKLVDVSVASGASGMASQDFGATTQDFDLDGDLDVFLTTTSAGSCLLLRNDGALSFSDATLGSGIEQGGLFTHCSSGDVDRDGWPDVATGDLKGPVRLYRNTGALTFTDVAQGLGVKTLADNFGAVLEDFDNDGWLDLFVPKYVKFQPSNKVSRLYRNAGPAGFVDASLGAGTTSQTDMGHNTADLDADGFPDIFIGTGNPDFADDDILWLVHPDGGGGFTVEDVAPLAGILAAGPSRAHGMAIGDFDGDGLVDVYVNNGGPAELPGTIEANHFFRAQPNGNHWAGARLTGVRSNRSAVGAHVVLTTPSGREVRRDRRVGHGFGNTNSPVLHFGLEQEAAVARLEVLWPSGISQTLLAPAIETVHPIVETGILPAGTASVGGSLDLDLCGPAGRIAAVYLSGETLQLPLPDLGGVLELAPPLVALGGVTLGPDGRATHSFPVPLLPALVGALVHRQAWFHTAAGLDGSLLSNRVTVTLQ